MLLEPFLDLLNQCSSLKQLKAVHGLITTSGIHQNPVVVGKLVETSSVKLLDMPHAMLIFTHSDNPNPFTWNTIIRGFSISKAPLNALLVYILMRRKAIETQSYTYAFAFKACAQAQAYELARSLHGVTIKCGHESHVFVANTAIRAYLACENVGVAWKMFDVMGAPNVVTWNVMIAGYVQNNLPEDGLRVFDRMWSLGIRPNEATLVSVLTGCGQIRDLPLGKQIHSYVNSNIEDFEWNVTVLTALIDMYARCRCISSAREVFAMSRKRDVGMWNALLGGYVINGYYNDAIEVFQELQKAGFKPDEPTLVSTLQACAQLGALDLGRQIHRSAKAKGFTLDAALVTALLEMYSKCGRLDEAREVFDSLPRKDVMAWTSMIQALAVHGYAEDALELFSKMQKWGPMPDGITFMGVLSACRHAGLVDRGLQYFEAMKRDYKVFPKIEHYGCLIDLLSRAGRLKEAFELICSMEIRPNEILWRTILSACKTYSDVKLAEIAVNKLSELNSDHSSDYVLLSNIYASSGRWEDAALVRETMQHGRIRKMPGLSQI